MAVQDYKINYKNDFVLTINGDAGWATQFCIKFWTGMPSQAYFVGFDGVKYVNCRVGDTPTQLLVMFDDHHLPIGKLEMQIAYHTTIEEFPGSVFDEVTNARDVIVTIDGTDYQVLLDFTGEDAPELEFDLPAYANEAERIQNELQRQQNEADRIAAELQREQATAAAVQGAENVNAKIAGNILTVTNRQGVSTSVNTKGEQGEQGPVGPEGPQGEQGISIVDFRPVYASETATYYVITFSDGHEQSVAIPKGAKGDTGATGPTGPQGPQGQTGISITGLVKTGETDTDTLYNITFSNGTTQQVAIPKGEKGDQGPVGPQGPMGDVAVITPEQQASFTMYSTTGQNTDGPMTQKAVTDNYPLIYNLNEADFSISDPHGSEIVELKDGHIRTKYFDSRDSKTKVGNNDTVDLSICDENDNDIVEFKDGHIRTKYFNSKDLVVDKTYSYKGEKISLGDNYLTVQEMMSITHAIPRSVQGCAVYGKYLFVADDYFNSIAVYDLERRTLVNAVSFTPNSNYHCNNANFGIYKYADTDATPCLYISMEKENTHLILVFQVTFSNNIFGFNLVQTITMPAPQAGISPYYPNSMIDADNAILYVMGYSTNSYTESDSNKIIVLKYELPLPTDGDITLQATDIYAKFPSITATQGGCIYKGKFYQAFGFPPTGSVVIRSSDMQNFCNRLYLADYGVTTEPEAACIYDDSLLVIGVNKKVYKFKF